MEWRNQLWQVFRQNKINKGMVDMPSLVLTGSTLFLLSDFISFQATRAQNLLVLLGTGQIQSCPKVQVIDVASLGTLFDLCTAQLASHFLSLLICDLLFQTFSNHPTKNGSSLLNTSQSSFRVYFPPQHLSPFIICYNLLTYAVYCLSLPLEYKHLEGRNLCPFCLKL